jgi:L,D-transpeptidase ErfK/SrfK
MGRSQGWEQTESSRLVGTDKIVTVDVGQSLYDIARAQGYALEHLAEANGLPINLGPVQQESVVIPSRRILPHDAPPRGIVVNIPERGFYVFSTGQPVQFFPIAVGEPGRFETPTGNYSIREKVVDPEWVAPEWAGLGEENVIPAGPDNPLGDRWIGLSASGLGMHSTNNPSSIGSATSHGCMRMYPEVARRVFELVQTGWPVTIEYQTSRVTMEKDGIYLSCFDDPYSRGHQERQLEENFRRLDLLGFAGLLDLKKLRAENRGIATKVVDLEAKVAVGPQAFPAARVGQKVYLEAATLTQLGVEQKFQLSERSVILRRGTGEVVVPLYLEGPDESPDSKRAGSAFLSRGTAWYPAKETLQPLSASYRWDGASKTLRIEL